MRLQHIVSLNPEALLLRVTRGMFHMFQGAGAVGNIECSGPTRASGSGVDGDYIVSAGADKTLCVIDPRGFKRLGSLRHHRDFIYSLQVNGGLCFSGAGDGALMVHDLSCGFVGLILTANPFCFIVLRIYDVWCGGTGGHVMLWEPTVQLCGASMRQTLI